MRGGRGGSTKGREVIEGKVINEETESSYLLVTGRRKRKRKRKR